MIRFILKRTVQDPHSGAATTQYETVDFSVPELEDKLRRGGCGQHGMTGGFDLTELIGAELKW